MTKQQTCWGQRLMYGYILLANIDNIQCKEVRRITNPLSAVFKMPEVRKEVIPLRRLFQHC